ncbi:NADH-cytochrome B5 reductase [Mycena kentingensis (nom. inval.)]|nr:NADH-cytochrome B5 reductase [Mycena kentingensis (nom. inval.)]
MDDAAMSPCHFTRATLTSTTPSGPGTKLLVLTVPGFSKKDLPQNLGPIWSVYIKDDDIQVERPYTPLHGIDDEGRMLFWVKQYPKGEVGRWLHSKHVGDTLEFRGPLTTWNWKEDDWDEVVMLSGGTGITPFFQLVNWVFSSSAPKKTRYTLLHSSRTPAELPPPEIVRPLRDLSTRFPDKFTLELFVDTQEGTHSEEDRALRVGRIDKKDIRRCLGYRGWPWFGKPASKRTLFLVCGPEPMISALAGPYGRNLSQGEVGGALGQLGVSMNNDLFGDWDGDQPPKLTDEEWERYLSHKRRWCLLQPLIQSKGYELPKSFNPESAGKWNERPTGYIEEPLYPHLLEGTRAWDKRPVMLKLSRTDLWEAAIFEHLASIPDADNHTVPFYDVITPPHDPASDVQWCVVVTPRLTDCREPHLETLADFIDFVKQILEGVCFMHRYNVAHTDVARTNVVWDERPNAPDDPHAAPPKASWLSWFMKKPRLEKRYYFIDFGLAVSYASFEERGLVKGICGQHRNIPELSEEIAYDPFALDIRQIGETLKRDYLEVYDGLKFLDPWLVRLRADEPAKRPKIDDAMEHFQRLVAALPVEELQKTLIKHGEWRCFFLWWNWEKLNIPIPIAPGFPGAVPPSV